MSEIPLAELSDRVHLQDTLNAYCDFVDTSKVDALVDLFTDDAEVDLGHGTVVHGRDAFRTLLLERVGLYATTNHHCSNMRLLHYDGTNASTVSYLYAFHDAPERDLTMHVWGRYTDELVKSAGTWQFRVRRLRVAGVTHHRSQPIPERFERYPRLALPQN